MMKKKYRLIIRLIYHLKEIKKIAVVQTVKISEFTNFIESLKDESSYLLSDNRSSLGSKDEESSIDIDRINRNNKLREKSFK